MEPFYAPGGASLVRGAASFDVRHQIRNTHPAIEHLDHRADIQSHLHSCNDQLPDGFIKAAAIFPGIHALATGAKDVLAAVGAGGWV